MSVKIISLEPFEYSVNESDDKNVIKFEIKIPVKNKKGGVMDLLSLIEPDISLKPIVREAQYGPFNSHNEIMYLVNEVREELVNYINAVQNVANENPISSTDTMELLAIKNSKLF